MNTPLRQKIVILTGAGISKESGLDTFRDKDGMWQKHDAMRLSSIEGFEQEPQAVLDFYNARRKQLLEVEPNEAHRILAELERWHDVTIITQNIDNLHERAGSTHVIHLHGELTKVTSSRNRLDPRSSRSTPWMYPSDWEIRPMMARNCAPTSYGLVSMYRIWRWPRGMCVRLISLSS